ncbi:MAG: glycosyltransferase [Desulforudis sp.]|jgi:tetratricopeptide (TPR) repeat protein|nr:MAG: glycosyltransferase [Desulforudis sp.]
MQIMENTISLCMIVRNEERNLDRCLKSTYGWVDEIVIVDTGSTDTTPEIARAYGALVVHSKWENDFSRARNEGLRHATGHWIVVLDADEELPLETAQNLKVLAGTPDVEAWTFTLVSPVSSTENGPSTRHLNLRMFRNRPAYRFEGAIHEQVKPAILRENCGAAIKHSNLSIMHYGYIRDFAERRTKTLRNISLLREALAKNPADAFNNYNLAASYHTLGDLEKARDHYAVALNHLDQGTGFAAVLYRNYGLCLYDLGEYNTVLDLADKALALFPDYPDLYFLKGQVFWELGMLPQAKVSFFKSTSFTHTPPDYTTTEGVTGYMAFENLAEIHTRQGDLNEAVACIVKALAGKPSFRLFSRLCTLLQKQNQSGAEIAGFLEHKTGADRWTVIQLLFYLQEYEECLNRIDREPSFNFEISLLKAKCQIRLNRYAKAIEVLEDIAPDSPLAEDALRQICIATWLQHPRKDAGEQISGFDLPDSPVVAVCRVINALILNGNHKHLFDVNQMKGLQNEAMDIAVEVLTLGDTDLALAIGMMLSGPNGLGEAYYLVGRHALAQGHYQKAKLLLEKALDGCLEKAEAYYLIGTACAKLNLNNRSLRYYLEAHHRSPGEERYVASVLEQLTNHCLALIASAISLDDGDPDLRTALFKLTSLRKKLYRLKEVLGCQPEPSASA